MDYKRCWTPAFEHNLTFRTNRNPKKSKTKCMAFLHKKRSLKELTLWDKSLPSVGYGKHFGNTIVNNIDYMSQDTTENRAQYIRRNNEFSQEFSFAYPTTKCLINNIFNTHFTGSSLWHLLNKATEMLETSWNVSQRIVFASHTQSHTQSQTRTHTHTHTHTENMNKV